MKIIISPSKTQNHSAVITKQGKALVDKSATVFLFNHIKNLEKKQLGKLMNIKNQLLEDTYQLYQNFNEDNLLVPAIHLYSGVVFDGLDLETYDSIKRQYMNEHVTILSAMYGPLEPNTLVWSYRLDMTMKPDGINLYHYWQHQIDQYFHSLDIIVNLASKEFSRMIKKTNAVFIDIDFKEENMKGQLRTISYNAKKARGMMLNQIIHHQIHDPEKIKNLVVNNYIYHEGLSTSTHWVFIKKK
jgi:cytoplasmic iron level regulating protein YaaA (DUF328/UPF0246 family)